MRRTIFVLLFCLSPILLMAEPIKIKTIQSYVETPTLGKSYNEDMTVVFEVDTLEKTLVVKTVMTTLNYKMSNLYPTINNDKVTIIKFDVEAGKSITKKYVVRIPKPLAGNKISVKETMVTATREMPSTTYLTDTYDDAPHFDTKYIDKHFHDINQTSPTLNHKCSISYSDKVVMIADLEGSDEMHILSVISVEKTATQTGNKETYFCQGKDEEYIFKVLVPQDEYSTPIFELTRFVNNKPVITTTYFGDILK